MQGIPNYLVNTKTIENKREQTMFHHYNNAKYSKLSCKYQNNQEQTRTNKNKREQLRTNENKREHSRTIENNREQTRTN